MSDSRPGSREGCADLAVALARHIDHFFAVGGYPVTHLAERLASSSSFEWSLNEKCATEAAIGLSAAGRRSCVVLKHNGLNVALDPLLNSALHSIGAAVVIVVGDDPSAAGSTSVQDSRVCAELAGVPVIEPAFDGDTGTMARYAVELSEACRTPVLLRVGPPMHEGCPDDESVTAVPGRGPATRPVPRVDLDVAHGLTKLGRVQQWRLHTLPTATAHIEAADLVRGACASPCSDTAVIAIGAAVAHLPEDVECRMTVRASWPVTDAVARFADAHRNLLVVEEPGPALEHHLRSVTARNTAIHGRLDGHLPPEGRLDPECVAKALIGGAREWQGIERKVGAPPPGRYQTAFEAIGRLHDAGIFVATDVGSSVRLCYPPYNGADVALCLGSAISVAGGAARTGRRAIALIGDFALLHSGIEALIEASHRHLPVLTVVLDNGVQAQIGGQPTPAVDLFRLVTACGMAHVERWPLQTYGTQATFDRLCHMLRGPLPAVAFITSQEQP